MRVDRRIPFVLCLGLFLSGTGAVWLHSEDTVPPRLERAVQRAEPTTTTTVATVPPTTTTTVAPAPPPPRQPRPAKVPVDPYADEPLSQIGTMEIPKIGLHHRVFRGISLRTIDHGPSHWPGTASPGQVGNAVFAGHRVTHSRPFRNIDQLVPGDEVIFDVEGARSTYVVTGSEVVTPKALHIVDQTPTATATLFACHPPGSAKFRYVVHLALKA